MDAHKNFAYTTVLVAPVPATSGTSLTVQVGRGPSFPATPFNAVVCVAGALPVNTNSEIVRVTNIAGDVLTIVRAQEGTVARTILIGDQIFAAITLKTLTDIEDAISSFSVPSLSALSEAVSVLSQGLSVETAARVAGDNALSQAVSVLSQALSVEVAARTAGDNTLSQAVSVLSADHLSLKNRVSAISTDLASTQTRVDGISANLTSTQTRLDAVSGLVSTTASALSARIDTQSQAISVVSQALSVETAARIAADNTLSQGVSVLSQQVSALSQAHSALSAAAVTLTGTQTLTNKRITKKIQTAADAASISPNTDTADITYQLNTQAAGTLSINADAGTPTNGQAWLLKIKSTNIQTLAWATQYVGGTLSLPIATSGSSKIDYFAFIYDTVASKWDYTGTGTGFPGS